MSIWENKPNYHPIKGMKIFSNLILITINKYLKVKINL